MRRLACTFVFVALAAIGVVAHPQTTTPVAPPSTPPPSAALPAQPSVVPQTIPPPAQAPSRPGRGAQTPPTAAPTSPRPGGIVPIVPVGVPARESSWQNVRVEVVITDSLTAETSSKKSVTLLVLDGHSGQVRSAGATASTINVDVIPAIRPDGRIYLQLILEYLPDLSSQQLQQANISRTSFNESLSLIVADGKPTMASQSSDPRSERKVTLEVTATVVK